MPPDDRTLTEVVREGLEKACRDFTARIQTLGFRRTKKMLWTRVHLHTADIIHFHRHGSTYGAPINASVDIRVQFGIRILNDASPRAAVAGPSSDPTTVRSGRYHLRFNARSGSTYERCVDDLVRFVVEQGEPWFQRFGNAEDLLTLPDSELQPTTKGLLKAALSGEPDANIRAASLKLLGIRKT